jgi:integrase
MTNNGEPALVPLPEEALAAVRAIMPQDPDAPVFGYRFGSGINKALRTAAKRAGLPHLSIHKIGRHTFAARLLNAGYDIKTVKEAGRWKTLDVVDETYGHLEQRYIHDAMLAVAENRAETVQSPEKKRA